MIEYILAPELQRAVAKKKKSKTAKAAITKYPTLTGLINKNVLPSTLVTRSQSQLFVGYAFSEISREDGLWLADNRPLPLSCENLFLSLSFCELYC